MEPIPIKLRAKYRWPEKSGKQVKNKGGGNGKRGDSKKPMRGSFTHCPPGTGDGKSR